MDSRDRFNWQSWQWETYDVPPAPTVFVTENPIIGEILGPDGKVLSQIRKRPPIGFRQ